MNDNAYQVEVKIASKNGWFTPDESRAWYHRYSRDGIAIHWWGDGTGADNHDNIVNYELAQAAAGNKSVNYVVSDNKITLIVSPDNVAWCTFAANAYTISFECQPTLGDEGYKKVGWLISQLRERYNKQLWVNGHKQLVGNTECPGTLDLGRMDAEAAKWANGDYNPQPTPAPTPPPAPTPSPSANIEIIKLDKPVDYITNKQPTNVWNFNHSKWSDFGDPVKTLAKGEVFEAYARGMNHTLGSTYLITRYSFDKGVQVGVNEVDLTLPTQPTPTPVPPNPVPEPIPVPGPVPTPTPTPQPEPTPTPTPTPIPPVDPLPQPKDGEDASSWLGRLFSAIVEILKKFKFWSK